MGKMRNPITFSEHFNLRKGDILKRDVIDVFLNSDSKLFIDPLLLGGSKHKEFSINALRAYQDHFRLIIKLLKKNYNENDAAWKAAYRQLNFPEIAGTRLGYGSSVRGAGWGPKLRLRTLRTAKEVIDIGIEDPDLFVVLALFEEGIGADRISDMATNIALPQIMEFNARVLKGLNVELSKHKIKNRTYKLPTNPFSVKGDPVILLPKDIVRKLPVVLDYSDISDTIDHNISLRSKVNKDVGCIWSGMTKKEKRKLRDAVLRNKKNFNLLLEVIKKTKKNSYDFTMDKEGEFFWKEAAARAASSYPLHLAQFSEKTPKRNDVVEMVRKIVEQYRFLVEHKGMWRDFWINEEVHRNEKAAQRLFYGIADSYCKANNLLITPEAETGTGPVDFKITGNNKSEVLVEIKLSTNNVSKGYEIQLETYKVSENTDEAFFVVIDLGISGDKWHKKLAMAQARMKKAGKSLSELHIVDASRQVSASRRSRSSSRKIDDDE